MSDEVSASSLGLFSGLKKSDSRAMTPDYPDVHSCAAGYLTGD